MRKAFCFAIGGVHVAMLMVLALIQAPTYDEVAHLPSGVSHWRFGRFELYRANPPLVRMLASLPVLGFEAAAEWRMFSDYPGARTEFLVGEDFAQANGERVFWLFTVARWACIPLSLLGAWVCFCWGRELYGPAAGALALLLWCFSPEILANGSLITPDLGAAAFGILATFTYWKFLRAPRLASAYQAGLAMGLALLAKLTWVVLFALWPALWLGWSLMRREQPLRTVTCWRRDASLLAFLLVVGLMVVNLGYGFSGSFTRLGDFRFTSRELAGPRDEWPSGHWGNRFRETSLASFPVPFPKDFILGLDVVKEFIEQDSQVYLGGEFKKGGWWYYHVYAAMMKVPLGTWLLLLTSIWLSLARREYRIAARDMVVLLGVPACVLLILSSNPGSSGHFRYALPIFPFAFVWISQVGKSAEFGQRVVALLGTIGVVWTIGSCAWFFPYSGSYFNELAGGPRNGHAHLLSSNIDWGQDLLHLRDWLTEHPEARPLGLAYFGGLDPGVARIKYGLPPAAPRRDADWRAIAAGHYGPQPGWYAVSVHLLRGSATWPFNGRGQREFVPFEAYTYFLRFEPVAMAGYSIYIYHVSLEDANRVRQEMGLPELQADDAADERTEP